jgi:hypothetical protein
VDEVECMLANMIYHVSAAGLEGLALLVLVLVLVLTCRGSSRGISRMRSRWSCSRRLTRSRRSPRLRGSSSSTSSYLLLLEHSRPPCISC